ncbi:MAG: hypothetical protein NTV80_03140 [Verrucomicrobia bacterium]|nr:hypothetical protein [Verrucomicrobiota bacterium]
MRLFVTTFILIGSLHAETSDTLLFSDDFNRDEATALKEDIGNGWTTNSAWRAAGKKQADLRDGTLVVGTDPIADHALVLFHPAALTNGCVEFRFKIPAEEGIGIEFADPDCKTVHAGHLCGLTVGKGHLSLTDMKTGGMDLKIRERRTADKDNPELKALLKTKNRSFPLKLNPEDWHTLRLTVKGDAMSANVNGIEIGSFASEGIAHPTKKEIRLSIGKAALIDDVKIWKHE